ncbi:gluconokinase [Pusillimonas sp. SM2304]|uniref:gluconokinase n=1 Tax=Pusillimonas sp. SM2304 TaxID=3073241 RepID=UPI0028741F1D|nr:gluconokinase [Pusillimonas sp. SM2304]MDS1139829.1 gluconokinase [Pusillimonas sp. SM2304]
MIKIALSSIETDAPDQGFIAPQAVVVMGVSGSGKSTVGQLLAQTLEWTFIEGDAYHSPGNCAKMEAGIPLTDADRASWLDVLGVQLSMHSAQGVVLSCSALKSKYRNQLRAHVPALRFIWLKLERSAAQARVAARGSSHFFPPALIDSQFQTLEPPVDETALLPIDGDQPVSDIIQASLRWLHARQHESI